MKSKWCFCGHEQLRPMLQMWKHVGVATITEKAFGVSHISLGESTATKKQLHHT